MTCKIRVRRRNHRENRHPGGRRAKGGKKEKRVRTVTMYLGVSNFQRAISIVIPRSRSAFSLSSTHAVRGGQILPKDGG